MGATVQEVPFNSFKERSNGSSAAMAFIRFILAMRDDANVSEDDRVELSALLEWFGRNLPAPERFTRSKS